MLEGYQVGSRDLDGIPKSRLYICGGKESTV